MTRVYVGIGSNIERDSNIAGGLAVLENRFGKLVVSGVYESEAVGFEGDNFYNLVAGFDTVLLLDEVSEKLRDIEYSFGRKQQVQRFLPRTLDIDLLLYGDLVRHDKDHDLPRADIISYAFVLCPLAEIAGPEQHPELGRSYADLWQAFDKSKQRLWRADFSVGLPCGNEKI